MTLLNKLTAVIAFVICALCVPCVAQTENQSKYPPPGRLVDVGGYRVHINCTGTGSPTVLIVGSGYSFDWGLVQPDASKTTQVCTYDTAASAWSDPGPVPTCFSRIAEIHNLLNNAGIKGPVVLVGHSIGAVFARLYASRYPDEVTGMVMVDHAATFRIVPGPPGASTTPPPGAIITTGPQSGPPPFVPQIGTFEDQPAFQKLPVIDREMHIWASSLPSRQTPRKQREFFDQCVSDVNGTTEVRPDPLGNMPLVVISTALNVPDYVNLQTKLLALSHNSKQIIAEKSGHIVFLDQPEVIVTAIDQVVEAVKGKSRLKN